MEAVRLFVRAHLDQRVREVVRAAVGHHHDDVAQAGSVAVLWPEHRLARQPQRVRRVRCAVRVLHVGDGATQRRAARVRRQVPLDLRTNANGDVIGDIIGDNTSAARWNATCDSRTVVSDVIDGVIIGVIICVISDVTGDVTSDVISDVIIGVISDLISEVTESERLTKIK